ncbi:MAG: LCP family protein [Clostridia bacterium]|nr:LCP family protein [Clostridia bacterium]
MKLRSFVLVNCIVLFIILLIDGIWLLKIEGINSIPKSHSDSKGNEFLLNNTRKDRGKPVNIVMIGLDDEEVRSDVILLLNYSPKSGILNILSITRDTRVRFKGKDVKFNSLIGIKGEDLVIEKLEELTGLPIQYYVTLNFKGFRNIIDTLDGVEIDVPFNMDYDDAEQNLHIHLKKGKQLLDGKKAEQYVRYRKGNRTREGYAFGDLGRIKAQQQFIRAIVEQKLKIKYLSKADEIFFILKSHMTTNIEIGDINFYLDDIMEKKVQRIEAYSLPGHSSYIKNIWYFIHDERETRKLINEKFLK